MRLFRPIRVIRTGQETPTLSDRLQPVLGALALLALLELVVRDGYRLHLPAAVNLALYVFEWVVVSAYTVDIALGMLAARSPREYLRHNWLDALVLAVVVAAMLSGVAATLPAIARQAVVVFRLSTRYGRFARFVETLRRRPIQLMALSFVALIATGTMLLTFPAATTDARGEPFIDALFTSTSAVCVTGLIVRDTQFYFTRFGQWVILGLIQLGGLGIMTFSASIIVLLGRRLGLYGRQAMAQVIEDSRDLDLAHSLRYILLFTFLAEALGAGVLFLRWLPDFSRPLEALFSAVFHSVSAFCNAGFSNFSENLVRYQGDAVVNLTVIVLIVVGGLGFSVVHELINRRNLHLWLGRIFGRKTATLPPRLSLHATLVLRTTLILLFCGAVTFFFFEYDNIMARLPLGAKLLASLFQSVTPRTAGFNTVPFDSLRPITLFIITILMFIGASPGGTGGGIKTSTLAVLVLTFRNLVAGRNEVEVHNRTIPRDTVYRAAAIALGGSAAVLLVVGVLLVAERLPFLNLVFEAASAFGTVGLSTGITPLLSVPGKLSIIVLMYIGRLGPLTLALTMRTRLSSVPVAYPQARVIVG